jgi:hypothetical protein
MQEASVNKNSLVNPIAGATGVFIALAAALVAVLAVVFVFSTKDAGAQSTSIEVKPSTLQLGDVAVGSTEQTTIKVTNDGNADVVIGGIDVQGDEAEVVKLVDRLTGDEFVVDALTGLLQDPLTILEGEQDRILDVVFRVTEEGPVQFVVEFLDDDPLTDTIIDTVTVTGEGRQCTIVGTEGDDQGVTAVRDTAAGTEDQPEVVCGLGGNDEILATAGGNDIIVGGPGNDTINMKDRVRKEYASGGSGKDLCKPKDKKDKVKSCGTKKKGK